MGSERGDGALPPARRVLAVMAHPDDESFGLGGVLGTWVEAGAEVVVLVLTDGASSTLGREEAAELAATRRAELVAACDELGVTLVGPGPHPDGDLARVPLARLTDDVAAAVDAHDPDLLAAFDLDGVTGHPDHRQATRAAVSAAVERGLPLLGWYCPADVAATLEEELGAGYVPTEPWPGDLRVAVDRRRQRRAVACHRSQRGSWPVVERRLELSGDAERLRWLRREPPCRPGP